jgi:hypothetical protein
MFPATIPLGLWEAEQENVLEQRAYLMANRKQRDSDKKGPRNNMYLQRHALPVT